MARSYSTSAIIEQDYDSLPGLYKIERDDPTEADHPPEAPVEAETPIESADSEPAPPDESPAPSPADASECNQMQHDFVNCEDVAPAARQTGLRSCPARPPVLQARHNHEQMLEALDLLGSVDLASRPGDRIRRSPADKNAGASVDANENETEEILT